MSWIFVGREEEAKRRSGTGGRFLAVGRDRKTAIERLRVGGRAKRVEGGWLRVMPPLGRALMGLWASEAYSFHPVSTSRFPSILFHNTPGDVYVLQDAREMRSRLHSDIGRFTARWRERRMGTELKEENDAAQQSLRERSSWDLRGRPDYFSHRRSAVFSRSSDDDRALVYIYLRSRCEIWSQPSPISYSVGNWTLRTYLEQKEKQIIRKLLETLNIDECLKIEYFNNVQ